MRSTNGGGVVIMIREKKIQNVDAGTRRTNPCHQAEVAQVNSHRRKDT